MEFGLELVIGRLDLVFTSVELMSHGVEPFLPAQLTLLGVWKMLLVQAQNILNSWHIVSDELVNLTNGN